MAGDPGSSWSRSNYFAVILALALCLGCVALACSAPALLSASNKVGAQSGSMDLVPLCAWARNGRAGLWWNSSVSPRVPISRSRRYNAVCIAAPWPPGLPDYGRPVIDFTP